MVAGRFFRKPDFQLRDVGASSPSVSFSLNASLSCSRQPVIVTALATTAVADAFFGAEPLASYWLDHPREWAKLSEAGRAVLSIEMFGFPEAGDELFS